MNCKMYYFYHFVNANQYFANDAIIVNFIFLREIKAIDQKIYIY